MPRTTLDLDPSVLRELRRRARRDGKSMGHVASEVLASAFAGSEPVRPGLTWISGDLGSPRASLEDREAVRNLLDSDSRRDTPA
jgi:plasmid stability protein